MTSALKLGALEHWFDGEPVVPGSTLAERLDALDRAGYQGIQLSRVSMEEGIDAIRAALAVSPIQLLIFGRGGRILGPDEETRVQAVEEIAKGLRDAAEFGVEGSILVPIRTQPEMSVPEGESRALVEIEKEMLVEQLRKLAPVAEETGVRIIVEPLNRYESHLIKSLDDAGEICRAVGSPGVRMMGDFFHMNIEDDDMGAAIERNASELAYIHLADSNRYQPGTGHLDFQPGFRALHRIGYSGYMTLECRIKGTPSIEVLRDTAEHIRQQWELAGSSPA